MYDFDTLKRDFSPCLNGRWRTGESLHATLLFLGEQPDPLPIIRKLADVTFAPGTCELTEFRLFERNRIFYTTGDHSPLLHCRDKAAAALENEAENNFTVHVTLMRYKTIDQTCFLHRRRTFSVEHRPIGVLAGHALSQETVYEPPHTFQDAISRTERTSRRCSPSDGRALSSHLPPERR